MVLTSLALALAGFLLLALAMPRHHEPLLQRRLGFQERVLLNLAGYASILGSVFPSIAYWGLSFGLTAWFGMLTIAAVVVMLGLSVAKNRRTT